MKHLRQYVRNLILTEACTGATAMIQKGLDEIEKRDLKIEVYIEPKMSGITNGGYDLVLMSSDGFYDLGHYHVTASSKYVPCATFVTVSTEIDSELRNTGIGAVLYDVAIEVATKLGSHLACDRGHVSRNAKRMWNYYAASSDYEAFQLDTKDSTFTPQKDDDCIQYVFARALDINEEEIGRQHKEPFLRSPLTKAYRKKKITTIPCLGNRYSETMV